MDKRGISILLGCALSTIMVFGLFMIAYHLITPTCELIVIEPSSLKDSSLDSYHNTKKNPIRSSDKRVLVKMAAYLEYIGPSRTIEQPFLNGTASNNQAIIASNHFDVPAATVRLDPLQLPVNHNTGPLQQALTTSNQQTFNSSNNHQPINAQTQQASQQMTLTQANLPATSSRHSNAPSGPTPQMPVNNILGLQVPQQLPTLPPVATINKTAAQQLAVNKAEPKKLQLMPLELIDTKLKVRKSNDLDLAFDKYEVALKTNCSSITILFARFHGRISVEKISVDLKLPNHQKTHCDVNLPTTGERRLFGTDLIEGVAHCQTSKRPVRLSCYHTNTHNVDFSSLTTPVHLVDLNILALEYAIDTKINGKLSKDFQQQTRKECDMPPTGFI